jgi:hypothetical protein
MVWVLPEARAEMRSWAWDESTPGWQAGRRGTRRSARWFMSGLTQLEERWSRGFWEGAGESGLYVGMGCDRMGGWI